MKKSLLLLTVACISFNIVKSQITKGNWMIGGNANFSFSNNDNESYNTKLNEINLLPNAGYFFVDKFAVGLRLGYYRGETKVKSNIGLPTNNFYKYSTYSIGPYIRYYFLTSEKPYNILIEGNYQYGRSKNETNLASNPSSSTNKFSFSAGPVLYFNSSIGLEFLLNYSAIASSSNDKSYKLGIGIGLQIHLEKDKP